MIAVRSKPRFLCYKVSQFPFSRIHCKSAKKNLCHRYVHACQIDVDSESGLIIEAEMLVGNFKRKFGKDFIAFLWS